MILGYLYNILKVFVLIVHEIASKTIYFGLKLYEFMCNLARLGFYALPSALFWYAWMNDELNYDESLVYAVLASMTVYFTYGTVFSFFQLVSAMFDFNLEDSRVLNLLYTTVVFPLTLTTVCADWIIEWLGNPSQHSPKWSTWLYHTSPIWLLAENYFIRHSYSSFKSKVYISLLPVLAYYSWLYYGYSTSGRLSSFKLIADSELTHQAIYLVSLPVSVLYFLRLGNYVNERLWRSTEIMYEQKID